MKKVTTILALGILATGSMIQAQMFDEIFSAGFETSEGYAIGSLAGQPSTPGTNWAVDQGTADVTNAGTPGAQSGTQYVSQGENSIIRYDLTGETSSERVVVRGYYNGAGSAVLTAPATSSDVAALIGFRNNGNNTFSVGAFNGTTDAFDVDTDFTFPVNAWTEVALNIRYNTASNPKTFDVLVNGNATHLAVPFSSTNVNTLNGFESHAETASSTDEIQFINGGNIDGDPFDDDTEFADPLLDPFSPDPARNLPDAIGNVALPLGVPSVNRFPGGTEHWHKIDITGCENITIDVDFTHAANDIQLEVYDARCNQANGTLFPFRVAESYRSTSTPGGNPNATPPQLENAEFATYVNSLGATELFVRIFEEGADVALNDYTLTVSAVGVDDLFEEDPISGQNNTSIARPVDITNQVGSKIENLVLKDDDFYILNTNGASTIDVTVDFNFLLGQMYFQVLDPSLPSPFSAPLAGIFTPNLQSLTASGINVTGLSQVVVRVFPAAAGGNFYDLTVSANNKADGGVVDATKVVDFALPESGSLPYNSLPVDEFEPKLLTTKGASGDDSFEENDIIESLVGMVTTLPTGSPVSAVLMDEDWYKVPVPGCESAIIEVSFVGDPTQRDIQLEVYEARCFFDNGADVSAFPFFNIARSYFGGNTERTTYVNNTDNEFIYVRVFEQNGQTIDNYNIEVTLAGVDDAFEAGGFPNTAANGLPLNQNNIGLILKDDDYFRIPTAGVDFLDITLNHDLTLGQIFIEVYEDNGNFSPFSSNGQLYRNFGINGTQVINNVDVSGVNSVSVRVFPANRGANFYDLQVNTR